MKKICNFYYIDYTEIVYMFCLLFIGPGQPPKHYTPPRPYLIPGTRAILPQNNLTQNLPLVSNLPPERFSVKDHHLLRPPPALSGEYFL